ncbi:PQQ-dependent sugar dehydrogenase [Salisediminibacterium halotolerans]|uniref:PQQ-dependent sugar dehydrogenase n=1 Tax=Salisediminibacterium halotolerans TaxID=517425 RepID=UPI000EB34480|nr:PQQ-dependent sugar dehydrogenase [Salisediminibacterium halotolerans]RLJ71678.1 glucose/arabinose dehydrogenase [Actinophytocola xinjiangensis]RPE86828.1 glucose/arabinose dehydrogenase [Salisediminibacterium halotolerans]TWG32891.1 glucose/arabinose dehydrogenase [Salisediminibacterium halotolerans]GEL06983.1 dehydrogenase [Salisediminibacterium halotolerans]
MSEGLWRPVYLAGSLILLLAACGDGNDNAGVDEENDEENTAAEDGGEDKRDITELTAEDWDVETVASNLEVPWSLAIADDLYIMPSRDGHMIEVQDNETEQTELETSDPIAHEGEGGLLGFILAEDESENLRGFAYYTYSGETELKNRIVALEKQNGTWAETDILLDQIPGSGIHNGGRLALGPDGYLYATAGDANVPDLAQDKTNLAGSILRMTPEGDVPEDNPFDDSYVYSYGHRNAQGLAWNSEGELYSSEHGPTAQDEINIIEAGKNYGWPEIEGDESVDGLEDPAIHSGNETWAPSGTAFYEDVLLVTGLRGESLYAYAEEAGEMATVFDGEGRLRDVKTDGENVYLLTNNTDGRGSPGDDDDRLLRLSIDK